MATKNATVSRSGDGSVVTFAYTGLANGDDTAPIGPQWSQYADRSVQFTGTFDTSTIVYEGGNDGTNYETLVDPQGNSISKTAAAVEQVLEMTSYQRARCTAGGGSTALDVTIVCRRQNPMRT